MKFLSKTLILLMAILTLALAWYFAQVYRDTPIVMILAVSLAGVFIISGMFIIRRFEFYYPNWVLWGLAALFALITLFITWIYIAQVPPPLFYDESYPPSKGLSMLNSGEVLWVMRPHLSVARIAVLGQSYEMLLAHWLNFMGVSFARTRVFGMLVAWASLPFVYLTAKELFSRRAAITTVTLLAIFPLFHNYIRADFLVLPTLSAGLYFYYLGERKGVIWAYILSGIAIGASLEAHSYSIRFVVIFAGVFTYQYLRKLWQEKRFVYYAPFFAYAFGNLCFAAFYIWWHVFFWGITLNDFLDAGSIAYQRETEISGVILSIDLAGKITAIVYYFEHYLSFHPIEFAMLLGLVIAAIIRRDKVSNLMLFLLSASFILLIGIIPKHNIYYYSNNLPFLALLLAAFIERILRDGANVLGQVRASLLFLLLALFTMQVAQTVIVSNYFDMGEDFIETSEIINEVLDSKIDVIVGWEAYYFGLSERTFIATEAFNYLAGDDWPLGMNPQAIIFTPGLDDWFENLHLYIEEHGMVRTRCWYLRHFGFVSLYVLPELAPVERDLYCEAN